jgi:hypothetical protein
MITKREIFDKKSQVPGEGSLDNNSRNDAKSKGPCGCCLIRIGPAFLFKRDE